MLGEVIYVFAEDPAGPPEELLEVYLKDLAPRDDYIDGDWDVVAAFNVSTGIRVVANMSASRCLPHPRC